MHLPVRIAAIGDHHAEFARPAVGLVLHRGLEPAGRTDAHHQAGLVKHGLRFHRHGGGEDEVSVQVAVVEVAVVDPEAVVSTQPVVLRDYGLRFTGGWIGGWDLGVAWNKGVVLG